MGSFLKFILYIIIIYWIIKAFQRIIAPFFAGYYGADQKKEPNREQTKVNKIIIDTSKTKPPLSQKPDIGKVDAEDIDFEEIK